MARPTKLTPEVQETICKAIRIGATYQAAAEAAGIGYDTFNEWRKDTRKRFVEFSEAVTQANADAQLDLLNKIQTSGEKDWRAGAWILERRFKQDYGQAVDVTSKGEQIGKPEDAERFDRALSTLADAIRESVPGAGGQPDGAVGATEQAAVVGAPESG